MPAYSTGMVAVLHCLIVNTYVRYTLSWYNCVWPSKALLIHL